MSVAKPTLTRPENWTPQTLNTGPFDNEILLTKATLHSQLRAYLVSVAKPTPTRPTSGLPKIHKTGQHERNIVSSCNKTRNTSQRLRRFVHLSNLSRKLQC